MHVFTLLNNAVGLCLHGLIKNALFSKCNTMHEHSGLYIAAFLTHCKQGKAV